VDPWHALVVMFAALSVAEGLLLVGLMRQVGGIYLQVGPPRAGRTAGQGPEVGQVADPGVLALTRPTVLLFLSPTCSLCPPVAKAIPVAESHHREVEFIAAVVGSATEEKLAYAASLHAAARTDLDGLYEEWKVAGTPFAVGCTADGVVRASGIVNSLPQIETLVHEVLTAGDAPADTAAERPRELQEAV
jgi:hypothetical protein